MLIRIAVMLLAVTLTGCVSESNPASAPDLVTYTAGTGPGDQEAVIEDLLFLREEEKLARDVYITLGSVYPLRIFANISEAEQTHMDAVLRLLEVRGIPDPVIDDSVGAFQDELLAGLYDDLVAAGMQSEIAALTVGATIEDLDLHDISEMASRNHARDVARVYDSLSCGSRNHMRAFFSQLVARGAGYEVQYISASELEDILSTDQERCGRR